MSVGLQEVSATLGGYRLQNWSPAYSEETHYRANRFYWPVGAEPGIGHVIMLAADLTALATATGGFSNPTTLQLTAGESIALQVYVEKAVVCSGGPPGDPQRAYLVTLRDVRFLLSQFADCQLQINVRRPAPPTLSTTGTGPAEFFRTTLDPTTGEPYTWDGAVKAVWKQIALMPNPYPGLPRAPDGIPQDLQFIGVGGWQALHTLLDKLDMTTALSYAGTVSIVDRTQPQAGLSSAESSHTFRLDDADPLSNGACVFPASFRVYFHKRSSFYGTEIDTTDEFQAQANDAYNLVYSVTLPTGIPGAIPGTIKSVWDDLPALFHYDDFGDTIIDNLAALQARAIDRAVSWSERQQVAGNRSRRIYQGIALGFVPGSQVSAIEFFNFGDGWQTAVTRRPDNDSRTPLAHTNPGWSPTSIGAASPELSIGGGEFGSFIQEPLAPPSFGRKKFPNWPRNVQLVQVAIGATKDANGLWPGSVVLANPAGNFSGPPAATPYFLQTDPCFIAPLGGESLTPGSVYHGRLNGTAAGEIDYVPTTLPLYLVGGAAKPLSLLKLNSDVGHNQTGTADLYSGQPGAEVDTGQNVTVYNRFTPLLKGEFALAFQPAGSQMYLIVNDELQGRLLVQLNADILFGQSGQATVIGGAQGQESAVDPPQTLTAFNWVCGIARQNSFAWANSDKDGWYLVGALGDQLLAKVKSGSAGSNGDCPVDTSVQCEICDIPGGGGAPTGSGVFVKAQIVFAPLIDNEIVHLSFPWPNSQNNRLWLVTRGELDDGCWGQTAPATGGGGIPKGGTGSVTLDDYPVTLKNVLSKLGTVQGNSELWVTRSRKGWAAISAECK